MTSDNASFTPTVEALPATAQPELTATKTGRLTENESVSRSTQPIDGNGFATDSESTVRTLGTDCTDNSGQAVSRTKQQHKGGAPAGNQNRSTHGLKGIGWPKGTEGDRKLVAKFTRSLRDAVITVGGKLDIATVATIQTAADWERHRRLCGRWLRLNPGLDVDKRRTLSESMAKASESRNRAIASLKLDRADADPFAAWGKPIDATSTEPTDAS